MELFSIIVFGYICVGLGWAIIAMDSSLWVRVLLVFFWLPVITKGLVCGLYGRILGRF